MTPDNLIDIAKCGVLAPSADNRHVFQLEFLESAIRLWPTPEFASTKERHRRVLGLLSLGAVTENTRLRAGELGFDANATWSPISATEPMLRLEFAAAKAHAADPLASAIGDRHTNRRMYRGPAPTAAERDALNAAATAAGAVRLIWLEGEARRRALGMIWRAESERFLRQRLHEELFSSIRFDLSWAEDANVSLPPAALEVEASMRPLFKALRHWSLMRPLTWLGVHRMLGLRAGWFPAWQAPALVAVVGSGTAEAGAAAAGAGFERAWLQATLLGLAIQPMAAAAVLPLQSDGDQGASLALRAELRSAWRDIAGEQTPFMLFRIGRAEPPTHRARRRRLGDYVRSVTG